MNLKPRAVNILNGFGAELLTELQCGSHENTTHKKGDAHGKLRQR